ncbi:MAG TPA: flippase [Candidatus Handelsmanbacteria bacterium]|jgi:O-antigen/teichoic acid export membrane protein|nr:flippase [Gemmatimonadota bacterium]MDB4699054.1 flippase [Candidatus Latescibacterota bacterium]HIG57497.1 flippase [Candidatus Handelsmanbacteria bacterium]MBT5330149.1 flippase [Gemmatimonadota bacterium]MBT5450879.1 flippase [Gemmatimonadota bacterium]
MAQLDLGAIIGRLGRNSRSVAVATAVTALGGLATSMILSRWLGPAEYGKYSYITWLVGVVTLVANLGLPSTATRFIAEYRALQPDWGRALYRDMIWLESLAIVGMAAMLLLWGALRPSVFFTVGFATLLLIPMALSRLITAVAGGLQRFEIGMVAQLICTPLQLVLLGIILLQEWGLQGVLCALLATEAVRLFLLAWGVQQHWGTDREERLRGEERRRIIRFAATVFTLTLVDAVVWQKSEVFFLERFATMEAVAVYSLAYGLTFTIMQLPVAVSNVLYPILVQVQETNGEEVSRGYGLMIKYMALLVIPVGALAMLFAPQVVQLLYGEEYAGAVPVLRVLMVAGIVATFCRPSSMALYSAEKQNFILGVTLLIAIGNVLADLVLIPRYGAIGAAWANSSVQIAGVVAGTLFLVGRMKYTFPLVEVLKISASAGAATLLLHAIGDALAPWPHTLLSMVLFPVLMGLGLKISRPWNDDDVRIATIVQERCSPPLARALASATRWLGIVTSER